MTRTRRMTMIQSRRDAIDDIVSNELKVIPLNGENVSGHLLTMKDGAEWFHPSSGAKPVQIKAPPDLL
jgi:hypothetical protein